MQKLGRLRTTLSADENQRLDALVVAAHGVDQGSAVRGYKGGAGQAGASWFCGNAPDNPQWYLGEASTLSTGTIPRP